MNNFEDFMNKHKHYAVFDLEATCCNRNTISRGDMEIIEIGAVMLDGETCEVVDEFVTFIKPVIHPTLTKFCKKLTTITQEEVDGAPQYIEAAQSFKEWLNKYEDSHACSWGQYDYNQFHKDSVKNNIDSPIDNNHTNIKMVFSKVLGVKRGYGVKTALERLNLEFDGTAHRGIDDARNTARIMPYIVGLKDIPKK